MGGRKLILMQMLNHQQSLAKCSSPVQKRASPPPMLPRRTPSPMYKVMDQFKNVLETFKRVKEIAGRKTGGRAGGGLVKKRSRAFVDTSHQRTL